MDRPDWIEDLLPELPETDTSRPATFPADPDALGKDGAASETARETLHGLFGDGDPLALVGGEASRIDDPGGGSLMLPGAALENGIDTRASDTAREVLGELFVANGQAAFVAAALAGPCGPCGPCAPMTVSTADDEAYDGLDLAGETADGNGLSLREAIGLANAAPDADMIYFASGMTITLGGTELLITTDITIDGDTDGDNKADVTISANDLSRVFQINYTGADVDLLSLTLTNGYANGALYQDRVGGAVVAFDGTTLDIVDTTIQNSYAYAGGGGLRSLQNVVVTITNSLLTGNSGANGGGAMFGGFTGSGGTATVVNTTVYDNEVTSGGGGLALLGDVTATVHNSTITGNAADIDGAFTNAGGGIANTDSTLNIYNSVLADNTSGNTYTADELRENIGAVGTYVSNSFFGFDDSALFETDVNNINGGGDPLLAALADKGGTTQTLAIEFGSQLIGAGDAAFLPADTADLDGDADVAEDLPLDANGIPRRLGADGLDIGAVQSNVALVVDTLVDENDGDFSAGDLSLREAIGLAAAGATITFDASLAGGTITLGGSELSITTDLTIDGDVDGDEKADITISGNDASRILNITGAGTDVNLLSLTLTGGYVAASFSLTDSGGAVFAGSGTTLNISNTTVRDSVAGFYGGGIYNGGTLSVINSTVSGNTSPGDGGGIYSSFGSSLLVINSTIHGNTADQEGGGIASWGVASTTVLDSTITNNTTNTSPVYGGGGLFHYGGDLIVSNSVIAGNGSPHRRGR